MNKTIRVVLLNLYVPALILIKRSNILYFTINFKFVFLLYYIIFTLIKKRNDKKKLKSTLKGMQKQICARVNNISDNKISWNLKAFFDK